MANGAEWFVVEQDSRNDFTPVECRGRLPERKEMGFA